MSQLGRRGEPTTKRPQKNNEHARWPLNKQQRANNLLEQGVQGPPKKRLAALRPACLRQRAQSLHHSRHQGGVGVQNLGCVSAHQSEDEGNGEGKEGRAARGKISRRALSLTVTLRLTATQLHLRNKYTVLLGPLQSGRYTEHRANTDVTGIVTPRTPHPTCERPT